jgi:6-phosphogluconolactonase (cycloisomerase 2 family)
VVCSGGASACNGNIFLTGGTNPNFVAVTPAGRFVYVTNSGSSSVSAYSINPLTGALTRIDADSAAAGIQNFQAGLSPYSVTVDPSGRFSYVTNSGSSSITAYTINAGTGALTQVLCGAGAGCSGDYFLAGSMPSSVSVDPTGRFAYVTNALSNNASVYGIVAETGALSSIGTVAVTAPRSAGFDPSGAYVYVTNSDGVSPFRMNAGSGELIRVSGAAPAGTSPSSIATTGTIQ